MVTSRDIARLSGVSQATVSRVLQDSPRVSPATRQRVRRVLEETNYAPDARARAMVTRRTGNVGVVVDDITNPFYPEVVEALARELGDRGLRMMLWDAVGAGEQGAVEAIRQRLVDGVVFTTATSSSTALANAAELGLPLVLFNRSVPDVDCDQVVSDNRAGGRLVADHLVDLGHDRVAFVAGSGRASTSVERETGLRERLGERGVELGDRYRRAGEFSEETSRRVVVELLGLSPRPTAVFCANDVMAFGAINAARSLGVRVPEELSVVGFDDIQMASWPVFDLTTVRQPIDEMVTRTVELLTARIADTDAPRQRVTAVGGDLTVRGSTAPRPRSGPG